MSRPKIVIPGIEKHFDVAGALSDARAARHTAEDLKSLFNKVVVDVRDESKKAVKDLNRNWDLWRKAEKRFEILKGHLDSLQRRFP